MLRIPDKRYREGFSRQCQPCNVVRRNRLTVKWRADALARYGDKCACCGETTYEFLCIDHINGGGARQRRETKKHIYHWLKQAGWPTQGFQVLCHNCNLAKGFYGQCPHRSTNA